ncbi:hypothetical protein AB0M28_17330 [Streptomyces sp. NPDC051940]
MYDYEIAKSRNAELRRAAAAYRLARKAKANRSRSQAAGTRREWVKAA